MADEFLTKESLADIKKRTEKFVLHTYGRPMDRAMSFGQGEYLYDTEGKQYLDFLCGIAVTNIGHSDADIVEALRDQAERLIHTSNLFYVPEQALLAEALVNYSLKGGKVFFTNSGTESNEAAFKLARSYGQQAREGASKILTLENSFHGRSTAAMMMTAQEKIRQGFGDLLDPEDFEYCPPDDIEFMEKEFAENGQEICAVILELIQGEGGVRPLDKDYVQAVRQLCSDNDAMLIVDEIQTGMGRTGKLFAYEHFEIEPDAIALAKGLGGGFPIGALIVGDSFTEYLTAGQHGSTFGGNHLACRVAFETLKAIVTREYLSNAAALGEYLQRRLQAARTKFPCVVDVRGIGLHLGMELDRPGADFVQRCLEKGLLVNCTAGNTIRILPPLNISLERAAEGCDILEAVLAELPPLE